MLDVCYVKWMLHVSDNNPGKAALCSMAIAACGLLGITSVVANGWAAPFYLAGLFCGTYVGMHK